MIYNRHRAILLTLLMSTNMVAMNQPQNNLPRRILMLTASAGILLLLARFVTNYFSANRSGSSFYSLGDINISQSTYNNGNISLINDEITINSKNLSQRALAQLPLIKPSGILETIDLNTAIEHVKIPGIIAFVHIDDAQKPRIEQDAAFKDLTIKIDNGILTVSTPNNEPRKFAYNGQPLCTIYAKLLASTLCASDDARVIIANQKIDTLTSTNSSHITGSVQATHQLTVNCKNSSHVQLNNIKTENLTIRSSTSSKLNLREIDTDILNAQASESSQIFVAGKAKNQILKAYTSSIINGKELIAQGGTFDAEASGSSQIFAAGTVTNPILKAYTASIIDGKELVAQGDTLCTKVSDCSRIAVAGKVKKHTLIVSNASTFDGSNLNVETATVSVSMASYAHCANIKNQLNGSVSMASTMTYTGRPDSNIKKDISSQCVRKQ